MTERSLVAALIGSGVEPSLTPALHEREGRRQGLCYAYRTVDIEALGIVHDAVGELVDAARKLGFDGLNITHPCKQVVIPYLDDLSAEAESLRAVNTVVFEEGKAIGHNTDVTGFAKSFTRGLPDAVTETVVQVGAGGAGAAVARALLDLGADRVVLIDVDDSRAEALARSLPNRANGGRVEHVAAAQLADALAEADGVVNATPVGMAAHPGAVVPSELLHPRLWVSDIVYRPLRTALIRSAEQTGCQVLTGAGMAVFQAVDAFTLITGRQPDLQAMFGHFEDLVAREDGNSSGPGDGRS